MSALPCACPGHITIDWSRPRSTPRGEAPNDGASEVPARWVVVVPVGDSALFEYLTRSFALVRDVRVVLERRRRQPEGAVPADDRGGKERRSQPRLLSNFVCAVFRRPVPLAVDKPAARGETSKWPHVRITDVATWTEESAPRPTMHSRPKLR